MVVYFTEQWNKDICRPYIEADRARLKLDDRHFPLPSHSTIDDAIRHHFGDDIGFNMRVGQYYTENPTSICTLFSYANERGKMMYFIFDVNKDFQVPIYVNKRKITKPDFFLFKELKKNTGPDDQWLAKNFCDYFHINLDSDNIDSLARKFRYRLKNLPEDRTVFMSNIFSYIIPREYSLEEVFGENYEEIFKEWHRLDMRSPVISLNSEKFFDTLETAEDFDEAKKYVRFETFHLKGIPF